MSQDTLIEEQPKSVYDDYIERYKLEHPGIEFTEIQIIQMRAQMSDMLANAYYEETTQIRLALGLDPNLPIENVLEFIKNLVEPKLIIT